MNKKNKGLLMGIITVVVLISTLVLACNYYKKQTKSKEDNKEECVIKRVHTTYKYNVNDIGKVIADADYVFVAKVDKIVSTVYKYGAKKEDRWISSPYTKYNLKVVRNIKGRLGINKKISCLKAGGKDRNSNANYVYDNDSLPKKGEYLVFMAYVQKDGSLLVSGANSSVKVGKNYTASYNYHLARKVRKNT